MNKIRGISVILLIKITQNNCLLLNCPQGKKWHLYHFLHPIVLRVIFAADRAHITEIKSI